MLPLLIDENIDDNIIDGLRRRQPSLDIVRVQDVGLRQTPDPLFLEWAAQAGRVVVSNDKKTLSRDAWDRVAQGLPMPGVALLLPRLTIGQAIDELELLATASEPVDVKDQVVFLPQ